MNSLHAGGFVYLPDQELVPGSTWVQSTDVPVKLGTVRFTHTATYAGPEVIDAAELFRFDTVITSTSTPQPAFRDLVKLEDAGGSGVLYFNQGEGQLDSYRYRSNLTMTMTADPGGEGLSGRMTYFTDSVLRRLLPGSDFGGDASGSSE